MSIAKMKSACLLFEGKKRGASAAAKGKDGRHGKWDAARKSK